MILGADLSSKKLAVIVLDEAGPAMAIETKITAKAPYGAGQAYASMATILVALESEGYPRPRLAAVERPIVGRGVHATLVQSYVSGAVQAALARHGWEIQLVSPSAWKKAVVGHGGADKRAVAAWLEHEQPALARLATSQDLADAACLALWAEAYRADPGGVG